MITQARKPRSDQSRDREGADKGFSTVIVDCRLDDWPASPSSSSYVYRFVAMRPSPVPDSKQCQRRADLQ
jgi:hypothetical protein